MKCMFIGGPAHGTWREAGADREPVHRAPPLRSWDEPIGSVMLPPPAVYRRETIARPVVVGEQQRTFYIVEGLSFVPRAVWDFIDDNPPPPEPPKPLMTADDILCAMIYTRAGGRPPTR